MGKEGKRNLSALLTVPPDHVTIVSMVTKHFTQTVCAGKIKPVVERRQCLAVPRFQHFAVLVQGQIVSCPSKY